MALPLTRLLGPAIAPDRDVSALMISGRPPDPATLRDLTEQGVQFLQKPFRSAELLQRVEQILREARVKSN